MPIPQVNDRIKEAPVAVLRAVFAGIGQLLLTADKVRTRAAEQVWPPDRASADRRPGQKPAWQTPVKVTAPSKATAPGKATAPSKATAAGKATAPGKATAAGKVPNGTVRREAPPAAPAPRRAPDLGPAATPAAPPLPGYDELSLPSLRARLRGLDAAAIQAMLAYERAHARREPVITMLERRLTKITAE